MINDLRHDLTCAHCGFPCTHHDFVEVYERIEDADTGVYVAVRGYDEFNRPEVPDPDPRVLVGATMAGNPSSRRQGVVIRAWCEDCRGRTKILITQHKGTTTISTEKW